MSSKPLYLYRLPEGLRRQHIQRTVSELQGSSDREANIRIDAAARYGNEGSQRAVERRVTVAVNVAITS